MEISLAAPAIVLVINVLTSLIKNWIKPKFGTTGVHVFVFALALIGAGYMSYKDSFPHLATYVASAGALFSLAVAFYEVILSHIPAFKGSSKPVDN